MMERRHLLSLSTYFILSFSKFLLVQGFLQPYWTTARRRQFWARQHAASDKAVPSKRQPQVRRKPKNRHAPGYWQNITNVEIEFEQFWSNLGVNTSRPPTIPNEALLNHFERNDLRYVVVSHGGRASLSKKLGGTRIMPGRWMEAVESSPELEALLQNASHGLLSRTIPPLSPQQKKEHQVKNVLSATNRTRWNHSPLRRPKGYWSIETVLKEL
jgi:hypothetical protein